MIAGFIIRAVSGIGSAGFGLKGMAIASAVAFAIGAASAGSAAWWLRDTICDAETARRDLAAAQSELAIAKADLKNAKLAETQANEARDQIEQSKLQREERIRELEQNQASKPAADRCRLDRDGLKRLLQIAPR